MDTVYHSHIVDILQSNRLQSLANHMVHIECYKLKYLRWISKIKKIAPNNINSNCCFSYFLDITACAANCHSCGGFREIGCWIGSGFGSLYGGVNISGPDMSSVSNVMRAKLLGKVFIWLSAKFNVRNDFIRRIANGKRFRQLPFSMSTFNFRSLTKRYGKLVI